MMKLIDFDAKFNKKMAKELERHAGERTEEEWEDAIAAAYERFGNTFMGELGMTPRQYFAGMEDAQLVELLKEYLLQEVPVPDFLCAELEGRGVTPPVLRLLEETDEELVLYALNIIGADRRAAARYAAMLSEEAYDEHVKDQLADLLKQMPEEVLEQMLSLTEGEARPYALEVLSRLRQKDDRAFDALLAAFCGAEGDELPLYAGYLAAYGDDRALPHLLAKIEEDVGYVAFQELKFAIESLGGEYDKPRDFSADPAYKRVMAAGAGTDIFGGRRK